MIDLDITNAAAWGFSLTCSTPTLKTHSQDTPKTRIANTNSPQGLPSQDHSQSLTPVWQHAAQLDVVLKNVAGKLASTLRLWDWPASQLARSDTPDL